MDQVSTDWFFRIPFTIKMLLLVAGLFHLYFMSTNNQFYNVHIRRPVNIQASVFSELHTPASTPQFDTSVTSNVTMIAGNTALLNCRVQHLGNQTVSDGFKFLTLIICASYSCIQRLCGCAIETFTCWPSTKSHTHPMTDSAVCTTLTQIFGRCR